MERLKSSEIGFLIALNASEESSINDFKQDISNWSTDVSVVSELILTQITEGKLLFMERSISEIRDYTKEQSKEIAENWHKLDSNSIAFFLTDAGWLHWEQDDWGISVERAKYIQFYNAQRVPNA